MKQIQKNLLSVVENTSKVIQGKKDEIGLILATWLAGGHVLLEDVPGTGKTVLAKALSRSIDLKLGRVQFTPDLLPSDVIGSSIYEQKNHQFLFEKGPLFCDFFLADEINRATPRTQSALLECMSEKQVTADNKTYPMDETFFVMATQNPIEHHGTFPLPEAQLDRFSIKLSLGYMSRDQERAMAEQFLNGDPLKELTSVISKEDFLEAKKGLKKVKVSEPVYQYVLDIVEATRKSKDLDVGASPRATLTLLMISKGMALLHGEDFVRPSFIHQLAPLVLGHRLVISPESQFSGVEVETIISSILKGIKTPIE